MKPIEKIIIFLGVVALIGGAGLFLPSILGKTSNCGGNSAALSACRTEALIFRLAADDHGKKFNVDQLSLEDRTQLIRTSRDHWIPGAKIFVRINVDSNAAPRQIVAVCDTSYGNIPQPTFWNGYRKNFAHAVGYMDGSSGLISPADFKKLNLSEFIDASLLATNNLATSGSNSLK